MIVCKQSFIYFYYYKIKHITSQSISGAILQVKGFGLIADKSKNK